MGVRGVTHFKFGDLEPPQIVKTNGHHGQIKKWVFVVLLISNFWIWNRPKS